MARSQQLSEFLRARRALVRPADVGLPELPGHRRVPGLRREELSELAGVSVSYYTRLEQGRSCNASDSVLKALATALGLDEHEHAHLRDLAAQRHGPMRRPPAERADSLTRDLLRSVGDTPALVLGRRGDVLAWNAMGHALIAGHLPRTAPDHPDDRPNVFRMTFLDPHTRRLYGDWERKARSVVGNIRQVAGRHPEDALLVSLVRELTAKSPEFAVLWSDHQVKPCEAEAYLMRHPVVGELTVTHQILALTRAADQAFILVTAQENSRAEEALALLRAYAT
ncbi:helix-turn-helix transcriptional regulator [Streptomyces sp. NPDC048057]|uniref:helix-turn-helix domain-containing protein n=1 Tax=Streptomyces sp. NPDC048057 TaxID=3155628 RepID=UPI0033C39474